LRIKNNKTVICKKLKIKNYIFLFKNKTKKNNVYNNNKFNLKNIPLLNKVLLYVNVPMNNVSITNILFREIWYLHKKIIKLFAINYLTHFSKVL